MLFCLGANAASEDFSQYVNPMIGSGGHGHVFVGANVPFGFVNVGPVGMGTGWDWCSGYHYSDPYILGFASLHLSGTGCSDLGDIMVMPEVGQVALQKGKQEDQASGLFSKFSHAREKVTPGYYSVMLDRFGIQAEMTATQRVGYQRYTFPSSDDSRIVFDMEHGVGDTPTSCGLRFVNDTTITGFRISHGWADKQYVYFAAVFSRPMSGWKASVGDSMSERTDVISPRSYGQALFDTRTDRQVSVKVALSAVSEDNALINLKTELPGWRFEETAQKARQAWNDELGRIDASFLSAKDRTVFYTSLYHVMMAPALFCDVNGDYRGSDGEIHRQASFRNYTTFSLWDTYRSFHPLATLIFPDKQADWLQTFLHIDREQGFLPIWHLMGNETGCMVGLSSVPVMADMCLKGYVQQQDLLPAYEAMKKTMLSDFRDLRYMKQYGYVPNNKAGECVSKTLEYDLDYWSLAQVARMLHKTDDYNRFYKMSLSYRRMYDPSTGFIRSLDDAGRFLKADGFNPRIQTRDYTEGNPWQYLWLVPHDVTGLSAMLGGKAAALARLDALFTASSDLGDNHNPDISGLIGQYAHGNEPSHHICYLYNYLGQPWKGAKRIRQVMTTLYDAAPDGLCGNEDVGQMSAWYVISAVGLYQVEPAGGRYVIGSPIVSEASLNVGEGKLFKVIAHGNSDKNIYVQRVKLNGKAYTKSYIDYKTIKAGGQLDLFMGPTPSSFGTRAADCPKTVDN